MHSSPQNFTSVRKMLKHIPCSFLQSPGLKSDILGRNYLTYRQQPSASSHIFCSHARVMIPHKRGDCKHFAHFIKFLCVEFSLTFSFIFVQFAHNKFILSSRRQQLVCSQDSVHYPERVALLYGSNRNMSFEFRPKA